MTEVTKADLMLGQQLHLEVTGNAPLMQMLDNAALIAQQAKNITINSDEDEVKAGDSLKVLRDLDKQIKAECTKIINPRDKFVKSVKGFFKGYTDELKSADGHIKGIIAAYRQWKLEELRKQREKEAAEAAQKAQEPAEVEPGAEVAPVEIDPPPPPKLDTTSTPGGATVYERELPPKIEVVNFEKLVRAALDGRNKNVTLDVLIPNHERLKELQESLKLTKKQWARMGLEIVKKTTTVVRT